MKSLQISLRPGERIYVNGAVLCADRKVTLEFLNEVTFLLECHVLLPEQTTTPLRQLYFVVQTMLIDPPAAGRAREVFDRSYADLMLALDNPALRDGLIRARKSIESSHVYEALKTIRALFPMEDQILASKATAISPDPQREVA
mgnify:CR=1 FL=1